MGALRAEGRAPRLVALENVLGLLASKGGADFVALCGALADLGYRFGALTIDAAHFVPQSRPRLFLIALADEVAPPEELTAPGPVAPVRRSPPCAAPSTRCRRRWRRAGCGGACRRRRASIARCSIASTPRRTTRHGSTPRRPRRCSRRCRKPRAPNLERAHAAGERRVAALFRRTRADGVRAEARFDGLAGCLRTPAGGSSRQFLLDVEGGAARARLIGAREAARLMGLPDSYRLPARRNEAYHLLGDGVVAPVVRFLSENLLLPLAEAGRSGARR